MDWRVILLAAGDVIKEVASFFGPIPSTIATFSVDALETSITAIEAKEDVVKVIEKLEDQVAKMLEEIKTGQN
jgi:formaldehyde-activating enzyme involved in methanogenesis